MTRQKYKLFEFVKKRSKLLNNFDHFSCEILTRKLTIQDRIVNVIYTTF